ncbi:MAG TPA: ABC transporter permease [Acidimicrobiia bacterium]|nr:ABC transporter permease [Acidimicrobiia bacterium]
MVTASTDLPVYDSAEARTPLVTELRNFWRYRRLIRLLVARDLTTRYKRSVLGVWWTLLNPLLTAGVMFLVFGVAIGGRFGETDEPYVVYLLAGVLFMTFFGQGMLSTASSIAGAKAILSKVYVPAEVFAFATGVAALANFGFSLFPLILAQLLTGTGVPITALLVVVPVLSMLGLVIGAGMLIAAAAVYFYDVLDLTRVFVQLLQYLTPVFYPLSFIPVEWLGLYKTNPLFSYLDTFRNVMYRGELGPAWQWGYMVVTAVLALMVGVWAFSKSWRTLAMQL